MKRVTIMGGRRCGKTLQAALDAVTTAAIQGKSCGGCRFWGRDRLRYLDGSREARCNGPDDGIFSGTRTEVTDYCRHFQPLEDAPAPP